MYPAAISDSYYRMRFNPALYSRIVHESKYTLYNDFSVPFQTAYFTQQAATCEMQEMQASSDVGIAMSDIASLIATRTEISAPGHSANIPQNFLQYYAIVNATWESTDAQSWSPYNASIQRYMDVVSIYFSSVQT